MTEEKAHASGSQEVKQDEQPGISSLEDVRRKFRRGSEPQLLQQRLPFRDTFRKSSLELQLKHLTESDLFKKVSPSDEALPKRKTPSWLLTGFTMRNLESLQNALREDRRARTWAERQRAMQRQLEEQKRRLAEKSSSSELESTTTLESVHTQSTYTEPSQGTKERLQYLLGLDSEALEEYVEEKPSIIKPPSYEESEDLSLKVGSIAMRRANKYLRTHKIFEFFQFLIAHLLSASPGEPIIFLLDLLDKCLIYRSGMGCPPLLFEQAHIEQLFFLMDRMETGFIEPSQYVTGMHTLGICNYNKKPSLSPDGMVSKETFCSEAYECLTALFVDMIRVRRGEYEPPEIPAPPPTLSAHSTSTISSLTTSIKPPSKTDDITLSVADYDNLDIELLIRIQEIVQPRSDAMFMKGEE